MELSKKAVGLIIALIVFSMIGLVVLQSYLLNYAFELKKQAFERNVFAVMGSVASKLEKDEAAGMLFSEILVNRDDTVRTVKVGVATLTDADSMKEFHYSGPGKDSGQFIRFENGILHYNLSSPQHVELHAFEPSSGENLILVDTIKTPGVHKLILADAQSDSSDYTYRFKTDSSTVIFQMTGNEQAGILAHIISDSEKQKLVARVTDDLLVAEYEPIERRIDPEDLDSTLANSLREAGIDLEYAYGVFSKDDDSLRIARPLEMSGQILDSEFKAALFPNDIFAVGNDLLLYFPDHDTYVLKQIGPLLFSTILFMLVISICFYYTIKIIIAQRRFAGLLVDFINNMTHEFKTPISTVSLASEAIIKPEIISDKEKVTRYNQMIMDENARMRNQVEKILQMTVLEKGDYELELSDIDIHDLLTDVVENVTLRVESLSGSITSDFAAENHVIEGDELHLSNIFHNLLDNAIKYSHKNPTIEISSRNERNGIVIGIRDQGVGIDEKSRRLVFNKYYRVPSGNVHDVRGFGLGLSYVKLMIDAHGGTIRLESEPGQGTMVELFFPFSQSD